MFFHLPQPRTLGRTYNGSCLEYSRIYSGRFPFGFRIRRYHGIAFHSACIHDGSHRTCRAGQSNKAGRIRRNPFRKDYPVVRGNRGRWLHDQKLDAHSVAFPDPIFHFRNTLCAAWTRSILSHKRRLLRLDGTLKQSSVLC